VFECRPRQTPKHIDTQTPRHSPYLQIPARGIIKGIIPNPLNSEDAETVPLLTTGKPFIRDLEQAGALGVYAPLEGGYEGRYQRRLRATGYESIRLSARGLGDLSAFLTGVHGVRPAHLGKKEIRTYFIPPIVDTHLQQLRPESKGLVLWLVDGHVLSGQELGYLVELAKLEPKVKVVVELGGDRQFRWTPLKPELVYI
jgi:NAD(P)H-quinone oxidoreductase subunit N